MDRFIDWAQAFRYERKYVVYGLSTAELEMSIKLNPGLFTEIYQQRSINNIYLDSADLRHYFDNVNGAPARGKVRIRWYGSLFGAVARPVLELKLKSGLLGQKPAYPLPGFCLDSGFRGRDIGSILDRAALEAPVRENLKFLHPVLLNHYERRYYQSADANYRITIDFNLGFYRLYQHTNYFLWNWRPNGLMVLELKYDSEDAGGAEWISRAFPFRVGRMSKYVMGLDRLHGAP